MKVLKSYKYRIYPNEEQEMEYSPEYREWIKGGKK